MAGSVSKLVERMRYWCEQGNLGYDQYQRWNIYEGGECDCSSLVLWCLYEAGFIAKPTWGYTGSLEEQLKGTGWTRVPNNGKPQVGDILLNVKNHVAVCVASGKIAQASHDERGRYTGGKSGDQTGDETNVRSYYNYPWDFYLRHSSAQASPTPSSTNTSSTGGFDVATLTTISKGKTGAQVKSCQALLNAKNNAGLVVDGDCGNLTDAAIRSYQRKKGLAVDGYCGKLTWTSLLTS